MKRLLLAVGFTLCASATAAVAEDMPGSPQHHPIGLGFHNVEAPVGLRWWFAGQKVGVDIGFGYDQEPAAAPYSDEALKNWAVDFGVPFVMHSWPKVHALFRPGLLYQTAQFVTSDPGPPPAPFDTDNSTRFTLSAEIEAEVFLADNVTVSASHGIAYESFDPGTPGSESQSSFTTIGRNFTTVGFHIYFLGSPM